MDAGARAASVVAELLAFYGEPALRRPPYLHGGSPMPDGPVVFRLALGRFASEGLDRIPESEREAAQVAAVAFVRQVCLWERATHYMVLCLEPDASPDAVRESYHLLIALIHPDRHDAEWPAGAPQRANQAYALLADAGQRAAYDQQLLKANEGVAREALRMAHATPQEVPSRRRSRGAPGPALGRFAVVSGVLAALFVVQAWWVGGVSPEHSLLERAIPASGRWIRSTLPDPPRFLGTLVDPGDRLQPLPPPPRLASLASWVPAPEARREPDAPAVPAESPSVQTSAPAPGLERSAPAPGVERSAPAPMTAAAASPERPAPPVASSVAAAPPQLRLTQVAPGPVAQRAAPTTPVPSPDSGNTPSRDQVEGLVALVVGFYDAGDAARLVAMMDPDRHGLWSRYQMRSTFSEFFDATSERRLRMERLSWQPNGELAQARGEAVVVATYKDGRARVERRVPVELDIKLYEGQPRISRLLLYPSGS